MLFPIIYGSVRTDRQGIRAARFLRKRLTQRGHEAVIVDPLEQQLPLLDKMYKEFEPGSAPVVLEELAQLYRRADGFLFVCGEYNHSIPPALTNLIDHFMEEYFWRPAGIVCYSSGRFAGVRAAMQLRALLPECGMPTIPSLLPIASIGQAFDEHDEPTSAFTDEQTTKFLDEFIWYVHALKAQRALGTPY